MLNCHTDWGYFHRRRRWNLLKWNLWNTCWALVSVENFFKLSSPSPSPAKFTCHPEYSPILTGNNRSLVYYASILYIMHPFCILCTHYVYVYYASIIFAHHVHHHGHGAVYIISIICSQTQLAIQTSCGAKKRDIDENFYGSLVPGWYHDRVLRNHHCRPFIRSP